MVVKVDVDGNFSAASVITRRSFPPRIFLPLDKLCMAKGKKAKKSANAEAGSKDLQAESPPQAANNAGEQLCAFCRSRRNRAKTTSACWLCGENDWIEKIESDESNLHDKNGRKPLCCANTNCWRCFRLADRDEEFCGECGSSLEECSIRLWLDKLVEPAILRNRPLLLPTREHLIDRAVLAGFSRATAANELEQTIERVNRENPVDEIPGDESRPIEVGRALEKAENVLAWELQPSVRPVRADGPRQPFVKGESPSGLRIPYSLFVSVILVVLLIFSGLSVRQNMHKKKDPSPTPTQTPAPVKDEQMILIEGGHFIMGRDRNRGGDDFESPAHEVSLESFYIDVFEVTREHYKVCVDAGACNEPSGWQGSSYPQGTAKWPVTGVSWDEANQYARFVKKRLPTEEEWEFAAGHGMNQRYPWGDTWESDQANIASSNLTDVGTYPSHFGVYDMIGNAQEWTSGEWKQYPEKKIYIRTKENPERLRVIRGGSYEDSVTEATVTFRNALRAWEDRDEESHYEHTGFRCVRDKQP